MDERRSCEPLKEMYGNGAKSAPSTKKKTDNARTHCSSATKSTPNPGMFRGVLEKVTGVCLSLRNCAFQEIYYNIAVPSFLNLSRRMLQVCGRFFTSTRKLGAFFWRGLETMERRCSDKPLEKPNISRSVDIKKPLRTTVMDQD